MKTFKQKYKASRLTAIYMVLVFVALIGEAILEKILFGRFGLLSFAFVCSLPIIVFIFKKSYQEMKEAKKYIVFDNFLKQ